MFGKAIGDAPLQVYISALLFSPTESIIRKQFNAEAPHWARIWPNDVTNWTSCVRRLDGNSKITYPSLSVSSCGTRLAAREGPEIRVWDVETGRTLCSIEFPTGIHSRVVWYKFSPRNTKELIVFTSWPWSLVIWDITTTKIVRQMEPLRGMFDAISLSPSAPDFLGMFSYDRDINATFALWKTQKK